MSEATLSWIAVGISILTPLGLFIGRHWLKARIERGVEHKFNVKIERVTSELRDKEEKIRSQLREREAEIAALRGAVLNGSASRQLLLDKRRLEAVEKVWTAVNDLSKLKWLSSIVAILKVDEVAKHSTDPNMQRFLETFGKNAPKIDELKNVAANERPFISETAWAYYSAFSSVLMGNYALFHVLKLGVEDPLKLLKLDAGKGILKAALPHQSEYIDKYGPSAYHYLLDELESFLLAELRNILEGREADRVQAEKAKAILEAVQNEEQSKAEREAASLQIPR